jgi:hypothetical protein
MDMELAKATVEAVANAHPKFIPVGDPRIEHGLGAVDFKHFPVSQSTITKWFADVGATVCNYGHRMADGNMFVLWKAKLDPATGEIVQPVISRLTQLEATVEAGLKTFIDVGLALAEIRENELWKDSYTSWKDYLQRRWNYGTSRARQIINGAALAKEIQTVTDVTLTNEAQARGINSALKPFPAEYQHAILQFAVTMSDGKLTPNVVKSAGDVLLDIVQTGTVDGNQALLTTTKLAITDEQVERIKRGQEIIQGKTVKRNYILKPTAYTVSPSGVLYVPDLPPGEVVNVSVWTESEAA